MVCGRSTAIDLPRLRPIHGDRSAASAADPRRRRPGGGGAGLRRVSRASAAPHRLPRPAHLPLRLGRESTAGEAVRAVTMGETDLCDVVLNWSIRDINDDDPGAASSPDPDHGQRLPHLRPGRLRGACRRGGGAVAVGGRDTAAQHIESTSLCPTTSHATAMVILSSSAAGQTTMLVLVSVNVALPHGRLRLDVTLRTVITLGCYRLSK